MKIRIIPVLLVILLMQNLNIMSGAEQINKTLYFKTGYSYLLSFDEKVLKYSLGDTGSAKVELLSNILNDRHEVLIKPSKSAKTNLLIWTNSNLYNFNLYINQQIPNDSKLETPIIQNFSTKNSNLSEDIKAELGELELDKPPVLQNNRNVYDFEIDMPPG